MVNGFLTHLLELEEEVLEDLEEREEEPEEREEDTEDCEDAVSHSTQYKIESHFGGGHIAQGQLHHSPDPLLYGPLQLPAQPISALQ